MLHQDKANKIFHNKFDTMYKILGNITAMKIYRMLRTLRILSIEI